MFYDSETWTGAFNTASCTVNDNTGNDAAVWATAPTAQNVDPNMRVRIGTAHENFVGIFDPRPMSSSSALTNTANYEGVRDSWFTSASYTGAFGEE